PHSHSLRTQVRRSIGRFCRPETKLGQSVLLPAGCGASGQALGLALLGESLFKIKWQWLVSHLISELVAARTPCGEPVKLCASKPRRSFLNWRAAVVS